MKRYILLLATFWVGITFAQSHSEIKVINGIPTVYLDGQSFNVSGWMLGRGADTPLDSVIHQIDIAAAQNFTTVQYGIVWDDSIAPDSLTFNWTTLDSVVNYSESKGLKIILDIQITMRYNPQWY